MEKEYWTIEEVVEFFQVDQNFLVKLEAEEIVCPICKEKPPSKLFPRSEIEKLRIVKILIEEMDVNLPGVEVILNMRKNMLEMRRQFDDILKDMADSLKKHLKSDISP